MAGPSCSLPFPGPSHGLAVSPGDGAVRGEAAAGPGSGQGLGGHFCWRVCAVFGAPGRGCVVLVSRTLRPVEAHGEGEAGGRPSTQPGGLTHSRGGLEVSGSWQWLFPELTRQGPHSLLDRGPGPPCRPWRHPWGQRAGETPCRRSWGAAGGRWPRFLRLSLPPTESSGYIIPHPTHGLL